MGEEEKGGEGLWMLAGWGRRKGEEVVEWRGGWQGRKWRVKVGMEGKRGRKGR